MGVFTVPNTAATTRRKPTRKTAAAAVPAKRKPSEENRVVKHTAIPRTDAELFDQRAAKEGRNAAEVMRSLVRAYGTGRIDV